MTPVLTTVSSNVSFHSVVSFVINFMRSTKGPEICKIQKINMLNVSPVTGNFFKINGRKFRFNSSAVFCQLTLTALKLYLTRAPSKIQSFAGGASQRPYLKSNLFSGPLAPLISSLSYHPTPNHPPGISCSFDVPVGLGCLDLLFFCRPCQSQLISSLTPWEPMSRCTFEVPARISSRRCWRSPLPHTSALIQRDFGCVLGVQQTKQISHVTKVDLVWQLGGCNLGQSLSNHGPHVFYRRKIRRTSRPGKQFNLVIDEEPLDNACHVWSRIILLKYGCGQALKHPLSMVSPDSRIRPSWCSRQMRDSSVKTSSFILPSTSFCHCTIGGGDVCGSASSVNQAMDVLRADHSAANGVEWYSQTLNDALQTQCVVLRYSLLPRNWSYPKAFANRRAFSITKSTDIGIFVSLIVSIHFKTASSTSSKTRVLKRFEREFDES
ncbi:uncharacterized protein TNCV_4438211 [Trichonephila clavipes]|nr:uncharacterized protein TNCV_4438211 [Trichonephila clavipes]